MNPIFLVGAERSGTTVLRLRPLQDYPTPRQVAFNRKIGFKI